MSSASALLDRIIISIYAQTLVGYSEGNVVCTYSISSAAKGMGCQQNSLQTPTGLHKIRAKIGDGSPPGAVFVGRRFTGEIYNSELAQQFPDRDWILTRILWLSGCELGKNRLGSVDSMQRYIYIHGTPDTEPMGTPASHGCIRMRNADVLDLFPRVPCYCLVEINP